MPTSSLRSSLIADNRPAGGVVAAERRRPSNAPEWYVNIESVECLAYTYELVELAANERQVMRTAQVPDGDHLHLAAGWGWQDRMTLRSRREPSGFSTLTAPLHGDGHATAKRKDLAALRRTVEAS